MAKPIETTEADIIKKFLGDSKILICDPSSVTRSSLSKILSDVGIRGASMVLTPNFSEAQKAILREKPRIVICEYELDQKRFGLELLQELRAQLPELRSHLFMLLTSNTSQTSIAQAAEEDVDSYILKPFTPNNFKNAIIRGITVKTNPSPYVKTIEDGKLKLKEGKIDEAVALFEHATTLDKEPSLAYCYLGQASIIKQAVDTAQSHFLKGLQANKLHYKCLIGLHEVLLMQKKYKEAYEVVKRVAKFYPANLGRLTALLRLTVMTNNFDDMDEYYETFINLPDRTYDMARVMCAALVTCGKHYAKVPNMERAIDQFTKASVTAAGKPKIIRDIILACVEVGMGDKAEGFLSKFPPDQRDTPEYAAADIAVTNGILGPIKAYERAMGYMRKFEDPVLARVCIKCATESKKGDQAEDWLSKAKRLWPAERF